MFAFPPRTRAALIALVMGAPFAGVATAAPPQPSKTPPRHPTQVGTASYYGPHHAGKTTASGEKMSPSKLTAASKTLPLGSKAKVTNLDNGKSTTVTVNDRGPYAGGRVIDLSTKAAETLDMKEDGTAPVKVKPLGGPKPAK